MIFAKAEEKEQHPARHRHRHRHRPHLHQTHDHAPSPSIYRRPPVVGGLSPRDGAGPVLPYHRIYHRQ